MSRVHLVATLRGRQPAVRWPATRTVDAVLPPAGVVVPRRHRRRVPLQTQPLAPATGPNAVWCADCNGDVARGDGTRGAPLTITDARRRSLLRGQAVPTVNPRRSGQRSRDAWSPHQRTDAGSGGGEATRRGGGASPRGFPSVATGLLLSSAAAALASRTVAVRRPRAAPTTAFMQRDQRGGYPSPVVFLLSAVIHRSTEVA